MQNRNQLIPQFAAGLLACGLIASLLPGLAAPCLAQATTGPSIPELPELNWVQRSDWLNVKTDVTPRAVGDGVADDTAALQAAFDQVRQPDGAFSTVYLPPGTYRITSEIYPKPPDAPRWQTQIHARGHGRSTRIVWDGPAGGRMFRSDGAHESTYIGIVWDGRGIAAEGFMFVTSGGPVSNVLHKHSAFMNFTDTGCGSHPDSKHYMDSSDWRNCLFINCGKGLALWNFNDYNNTIDGCEFHDNGFGIWNYRGNFYVRNSHFQRSTQADIADTGGIHGNSARRVTSVGSRAFLHHRGSGSIFTIQDCHVSGWTNPDGAISGGSPMLLFDCVFTHAPSANPPIPLNGPASVVHSNNRTSTAALFGGSTENVVEVPKGQRGGSVTSAQQRFFRSEAAIPTRVFDAKRDFDGDVQRCIDAARQHGRGAIAYLPRGNYRIGQTINITGGDYYVGGAGIHRTMISRRDGDNSPAILVSDPQNVTMEYLSIRTSEPRVTIRQVSTTQRPSRMHYQHVDLEGGSRADNPETFTGNGAFEAVGLSKGSVLTVDLLRYGGVGGISFDNCSSARILLNHIGAHSFGVIRVRGTQSDRDGFFGVLTGQTRLRIEDNQSIVSSDNYVEQMGFTDIRQGPYAHLMGSPTLPAGRVTLSAPKMSGADANKIIGSPYEEYITVNNYRGQLSSVMSQYDNLSERFEPDKKAFKIVCTGEAPLDILLMANQFQQGIKPPPPSVLPVIEGGPNVTRTLLGNRFSHLQWHQSEPVANVLPPNGLRVAALALDDFRELGELDLELNHAEQ